MILVYAIILHQSQNELSSLIMCNIYITYTQWRVSLETYRCHCTPQFLYKYHIRHDVSTNSLCCNGNVFSQSINCPEFDPSHPVLMGFEPSSSMIKSSNCTTTPVQDIIYFLKPFPQIFGTFKKNLKIRHCIHLPYFSTSLIIEPHMMLEIKNLKKQQMIFGHKFLH